LHQAAEPFIIGPQRMSKVASRFLRNSVGVSIVAAIALFVSVFPRHAAAGSPYAAVTAPNADSPWTSRAGALLPDPSFRLGDAARPFGSSTVVGDLNRDGTPDVAIADHLAPRPDGYSYRLEFSVSGQRPQAVTFESTHNAVTISLADVDHDNDFDIVVGVPLSGETLGVWLNDGYGRFTPGDVPPHQPAVQAIHSLGAGDPLASTASLDFPQKRAHDASALAARVEFTGQLPHSGPSSIDHRSSSRLRSSANGPRAPPQSFSL
jgi:hypothetical protein